MVGRVGAEKENDVRHTSNETLLVRCLCGCSIYSSKEEPTLFLERCFLHDSAPDLLAACETVLAALDKINGGGGFDLHDSDRCRDILRAEIAKVRGEAV